MNYKPSLTPSEFYRNKRPENFSDSKRIQEVILPKEQLAFELHQLTTNQKEAAFETFGRRLAEKLVAPNLIPQVGPTAGGDGKTDSETYPVSEFVSERWFVPENGWERNENWAIAISAQQDWKPKVKKDVKSIVNTNRGYTKIFFISNQTISSKNRKETQDELKSEFGIEVTILDAAWIIDKIYSNDLINIAVESLNLSSVYTQTTKVGSNDVNRLEVLKELEDKISNSKRYFEYDYQLVEDALQAAILTRMLEKSKDEVIGKFDRALRFGNKLNNPQQLARIHYQLAWTFVNWYDDFENFYKEFQEFKKQVKGGTNISNLELYCTLINLFRSVAIQSDKFTLEDFQREEAELIATLEPCIQDKTKPTLSLTARTYRLIIEITPLLQEENLSTKLPELQKAIEESVDLLEYPFDQFKDIIEVYGKVVPNSKEYDSLIDSIAALSEKRASERSAGETFLTRAIQKFENGYYKDSLIYFGKSVKKLAKEESDFELYLTMMSMGIAYRHLGLLWASNNAIIAATSILIKQWHNTGKLHPRLTTCFDEAIKNELFIGRVPHLLMLHELFKVILRQFEQEDLGDGDIPPLEKIDACLSVRLLNEKFENWNKHSWLPDIFKKEELFLSQDAALYTLGYTELVETSHIKEPSRISEIDNFYNRMANQPFKDQIDYATNLADTENSEYNSVILGSHFTVKFKCQVDLAILGEIVLAYFEGFLATSRQEIFPSSENIIIELSLDESLTEYTIDATADNKYFTVHINKSTLTLPSTLSELIFNLFVRVLVANFIIKGDKEYLEKLFKTDEVHERVSIIISHKIFLNNIFGNVPKIFLQDWRKSDVSEYPMKRTINTIKIEKTVNDKKQKPDFDNSKHNQTKVSSIINTHLWDQASWQAFGYFSANGVPLGIFLAFENEQFGKQIFENWIKDFGRVDKNETIQITIVRGVDIDNPSWYRVHVSKKLKLEDMKEGQFFLLASRIREINALNDNNLSRLIASYNQYKRFILFPAKFEDGRFEPFLNLGIMKTELIIKDAWEIGENDLDAVVIGKDDKPIIPSDKPDAPVIGLLKRKQQKNEDL